MREVFDLIESTPCPKPRIWWLGGPGFALKHHNIVFYVDPQVEDARSIAHADLVLLTHVEEGPFDSAIQILESSKRAKVVLPKSRAEALRNRGIPFHRMTTTDSDLRIEYFKAGVYGRVYSVPSARGGQLDWTPIGGYPRLGYLIRFGDFTIYHAGACTPYEGIAGRLRPYNVRVALLPVGEGNFEIAQAGQLAEDIGALWAVPMACDSEAAGRFTMHMLGHRPAQRFKIFELGEGWTPSQDDPEAEDHVI